MSNKFFESFSTLHPVRVGINLGMFWTTLLCRFPLGFERRGGRDVREYVTRHFFKEAEGKFMISVTEEAREHILAKGGTVYLLDTKPV
ncbi:MAG: hypothetical protein ACM32K_06495, partial [Syntrophaceae bacterium]